MKVLVGATLLALVFLTAPAARGQETIFIRGIPADCSVDVTGLLQGRIHAAPDGSTIVFPERACYRIDGTLEIWGRFNLTIEGRGTTLRAYTQGDRNRRHVLIRGGRGIRINRLTVVGANPYAGLSEQAYRADREAQAGFFIAGAQDVVLERVRVTDVWGDFVYVGPLPRVRPDEPLQWARGVSIFNAVFERNGRQGVAITAGEDVAIVNSVIREVRRTMFDIEPNWWDWGARRIRIVGNRTGRARGLWFAAGAGSYEVRDIHISGNVMDAAPLIPAIAMRSPVGGFRGPITVEGNTFTHYGSTGYHFTRVRGIVVRNNHGTWVPRTQPVAVRLFESSGARIYNNLFCGATGGVLVADDLTTDAAEWGNTLNCP